MPSAIGKATRWSSRPIGFTDASWLHKNGWVHGFDMKVTERLTRDGDKLMWQATVEIQSTCRSLGDDTDGREAEH